VGFWLPFVITAFEDEHYWAWRVGGIPATGHCVQPVATERCCVIFEVPLIAAPYGIVCQRALDRIARLLAAPDELAL
jgi:hypothetical protein